MQLTKQQFGTLASGEPIDLYTLRNRNGLETTITNFGGRVVTLKTPDRNGNFEDIVLGFDTLDGYVNKNPYFGAIVGRYANRIGNAEFSLNGKTYKLAQNAGPNSLHGGTIGFDQAVWKARDASTGDSEALELKYLSKDGEEGYPGNLDLTVLYTLTPANELKIEYLATTDKETILNLSNHSYFDLSGFRANNILNHIAEINADRFTPTDAASIPTGELRDVTGTPFDFRSPTRIGERIDNDNEQLKFAQGYDHNYVLNRTGNELSFAARVTDPESGRVLEVLTNQPGVQFYTGNHLTGHVIGKGGITCGFRFGFCLETQHFPDSPHHPNFPSTTLRPGEEFRSTTVYRFLR